MITKQGREKRERRKVMNRESCYQALSIVCPKQSNKEASFDCSHSQQTTHQQTMPTIVHRLHTQSIPQLQATL